MQRHIASALLALCLGLTPVTATAAGAAAAEDDEGFRRLTVAELAARIKEQQAGKGRVYIFDNNPRSLYRKGHIPGAKWVQYDDVKPSDLPADKGAPLVFYCANEH